MENVASFVAALAVVASILPGAVAEGRTGRLYKLRLDGYVGAPPEGRRERADLQLRAGEKDVRFQVTGATVLSGDMMASTIFNRVRPYRPNFILRGQRPLVAQVGDAASGARLRIVGAWRPGSRDLLLSTVETPPGGDRPASP